MPLLTRSGTAVATLVVAAALPCVGAAPAQAAACGSGGVTVVVEHNDQPGGTDVDCLASGGGQTASRIFPAAGHPLTYAQRQPGYVCRVDAVPASDPCVNTSPASAYWALYWTDGTDGEWHYSTLGVGGLTIPDGGSVAFVWDDQSGDVEPATTPPRATTSAGGHSSGSGGAGNGPAPTRSPAPTPSPDASPSAAASSGASDGATAEASAGPGGSPGRHHTKHADAGSGSPSATAGATDDPGATASSDPEADAATDAATDAASGPSGGGVPAWAALLGIGVIGAGAGGVALARRRGSRS